MVNLHSFLLIKFTSSIKETSISTPQTGLWRPPTVPSATVPTSISMNGIEDHKVLSSPPSQKTDATGKIFSHITYVSFLTTNVKLNP